MSVGGGKTDPVIFSGGYPVHSGMAEQSMIDDDEQDDNVEPRGNYFVKEAEWVLYYSLATALPTTTWPFYPRHSPWASIPPRLLLFHPGRR